MAEIVECSPSFLRDLSSRAPTPGGGSASALVGAVSAALCGMVGRLNDKKDGTPGKLHDTIETADADFNVLGIQMRGYHDFGVALQDPKGGVKSKGEA